MSQKSIIHNLFQTSRAKNITFVEPVAKNGTEAGADKRRRLCFTNDKSAKKKKTFCSCSFYAESRVYTVWQTLRLFRLCDTLPLNLKTVYTLPLNPSPGLCVCVQGTGRHISLDSNTTVFTYSHITDNDHHLTVNMVTYFFIKNIIMTYLL